MKFYTEVKRKSSYIYVRGYDDKGKRIQRKVRYKPHLYIESPNNKGWTTMDNKPVERIEFDSMWDAHQYAKHSTVYGNMRFDAQWLQTQFPDEIDWDRKMISVLNLDIEVVAPEFPEPDDAAYPMTSVSMYSSRLDRFLVYTVAPIVYDVNKTELNIPKEKILHYAFPDEKEMIKRLIQDVKMIDPDVLTGWNVRGFDIPYVVNRIIKIFGQHAAEMLSPFGIVEKTQKFVKGRDLTYYDILGIQTLDYMDLFMKFGYAYGPQESYSLNHISYVVLEERKLDYDEYGNLTQLYENDPQKYVDYNIRDVDLVKRIDDVCDYIMLAHEIGYKAGTNPMESLGTNAVWDTMIYRELCRNKVAVPQPKEHAKADYVGGYVMEPIVGFHDWVVSFDLNSLYPSLIIQLNISPETIRGVDPRINMADMLDNKYDFKGKNHTMAANGAYFDRSKRGFIPTIVADIYDDRVATKKEMKKLKQADGDAAEIKRLDNKQQSLKILLNSLYGALASRYFRYYDIRMAEAITYTGRVAIQWSQREINSFLGKEAVIAIDTDSNYVALGDAVSNLDEALAMAQDLEDQIKIGYDEFASMTNSFENRMVMKREVIADRGVWTAKKRYILQVLDDEGFRLPEPKIKITGIEAIRSSTPEICRKWFEEMFKIIVNEPEPVIRKAFRNYRKQFFNMPAQDIAQSMSANNIGKFSDPELIVKPKSGAPLHVRGTLYFNDIVKKQGLEGKYNYITTGEKVKYIRLRVPNPLGQNVISFTSVLPDEFELTNYIDYPLQFEKVFAKPIRSILDKVGYNLSDRTSIDEFFK